MKLSKKLSVGAECTIKKQTISALTKASVGNTIKASAKRGRPVGSVNKKSLVAKTPAKRGRPVGSVNKTKQTVKVITQKSDTTTTAGFANVINKNGGKFFSCEFTKLDGSQRKIHCRIGAKGVPAEVTGSKLLVYDLQAKGIRTVNLDTVATAKVKHTTYKII